MEKGFLNALLRMQQTVFSFKDLLLLWSTVDPRTAATRINYYCKKGQLYHVRRGLYAKDNQYDRFELATKIFTPSYISFETVLREAGVIFQHYESIFVATYQSKEITCDGRVYAFKKMKGSILTNTTGIEKKIHYYKASPERALLDTLYLYRTYHFDNLRPINWEKVYEILPIYDRNKRIEKKIKEYKKAAKIS